MGRRAQFTDDDFLDAAVRLISEGGPSAATIGAIADLAGAPTGSVYHRFASRDLLLARLWIRTVQRFQQGFLEVFAGDDLDVAAEQAALHVVRWSREHLAEARVLLLHRQDDLAQRWPAVLGEELATLNSGVVDAIRRHARKRYGRVGAREIGAVTLAVVDLPYAACRRYLGAGKKPPLWVDDLVIRSVPQLLGR
jgi:AcrR family transcriptional regulator